MAEFTVKSVEFEEQKSVAEIEEQLINEHEQKLNGGTPAIVEANFVENDIVEEKDLDDNVVLSHINKKFGRDYSSLDEYSKEPERIIEKEDLPEDVNAFLQFKKETGRGLEDFLKVNKNFDDVDSKSLLKDYLKEQNPELTKEEIDFEFRKRFDFDEDLDDDDEINSKKIDFKKELSRAKGFFEEQKEKYKIPLESRTEKTLTAEQQKQLDDLRTQMESSEKVAQENEKRSQFFAQKTEELFSKEFEGFKFKAGEKEIVYKPAEAEKLKEQQSGLSTFVSKFLNEDGYLKDAAEFHRSIAIASDPNAFAKFFYEKGQADMATDHSRDSKNINMNRGSVIPQPASGFQVKVVDDNQGRSYGIKSKFKN
jgi:hypothetical protein